MARKIKKTWGQVLNNIVSIAEDPCSLKWSLVVDTFFPALGKAALFLITPSPIEMLRRYTIPKLGRKGPKGMPRKQPRNVPGRFGTVRIAYKGGLPDPAEWIASKIPGRIFFANRVPGKLETLFWTNVQRIEAVLWYFLVIATAKEFLYEWSSGIMESRYCHAQYPLFYSGSLDLSCQALDNIVRIICMRPVQSLTMTVADGTLRTISGEKFTGRLWLTLKAINSTLATTNGGIIVNGWTFEMKALAPGETYDGVMQFEITPVFSVQIICGIFFPGATIQAAEMFFLGDYA